MKLQSSNKYDLYQIPVKHMICIENRPSLENKPTHLF